MRCVWGSLWIDEDAVCCHACYTCLYIYSERLIIQFQVPSRFFFFARHRPTIPGHLVCFGSSPSVDRNNDRLFVVFSHSCNLYFPP